MKTLIKTLCLSSVFLLYSCGDGESFIEDLVYQVQEDEVEVGVEFNDYLDIELEARIPIKEYGTLNFIPAGRRTGAMLSFSLDMTILEDEDLLSLKRTRKLPNGSPMSRYVETDLLWLKLKRENHVRPHFYLGTEEDDFYIGAALEFSFIDEDFPDRLTISQRFRDSKGRLVAVMSLFGPRLNDDGSVKDHGGVFFATNLTDLEAFSEEDSGENLSSGVYSSKLIVEKDGELHSMSDRELRSIAKKFKKAIERFNDSQD